MFILPNDHAEDFGASAMNILRRVVGPSVQFSCKVETAGKKARQALVGPLYDQDFLNRIEKSLATFRSALKKK